MAPFLTHEYDPKRPGVTRCGLEEHGLHIVSGEADDKSTTSCYACRLESVTPDILHELHLYHCAAGHTRAAMAGAACARAGFVFETHGIYWPDGVKLAYTADGEIDYRNTKQEWNCSCEAINTPDGLLFKRCPLHAAAPDLLAAAKLGLEKAESWIHDQLDGTRGLESSLAELEPIRVAIAKAEVI